METVIRKELLDYLQSIQFVVLFCIGIVLFSANGLIFSAKYSRQQNWYDQKTADTWDDPSTVSLRLYKQPSPLLFLAEGGDKFSPPGYQLHPKGFLSPVLGGSRNFKLPDLPEPDWVFIVKIIFSLYAILLGYRAVSGEKEQGTLRLALSNPISRARLLAAKYIAIILALMIPLATGMLISLAISGFKVPQILNTELVLKIILTFISAFIYLSIFVFLSLALSSLIHQSSLVLLVLLAVWVLFVVMVPNTSGILAERFSETPSEYQTAKMVSSQTIRKLMSEKIRPIRDKAKQGKIKTEAEFYQQTDAAFDQLQQELTKSYNVYDNAISRRQMLARNISRLSPTALLQYASENIAGTGFASKQRFLDDIKAYSSVYDNYVLKKVGKLVEVTSWSFAADFEFNGKRIILSSPHPEEYQGDKSDFPRFSQSQPSARQSLRYALLDISGLVLWNLVLAMAAFAAFNRSDVR